jgi:integrase
MIINAGLIPLGYAAREGLIPQNPADKLERFSDDSPGRGVLTPQEAGRLFSVQWPDKRAYTGNLLAMTSGLRHGEILALRESDIVREQPVLHIRHSWSGKDGLKGTKNGEARRVPVLPEVKEMLLGLLKENPHQGKDRFIFWGIRADRPSAEGDFLRWGLKAACREMENHPPEWKADPSGMLEGGTLWVIEGRRDKKGNLQGGWSDPEAVNGIVLVAGRITDTDGNYTERLYMRAVAKPEKPVAIDCKQRKICFHSHRHFYCARLADKMTAEQIQRVSGHKSKAVFEHYADHVITENILEMGRAGQEIFGKILQFGKGA